MNAQAGTAYCDYDALLALAGVVAVQGVAVAVADCCGAACHFIAAATAAYKAVRDHHGQSEKKGHMIWSAARAIFTHIS